MVFQGCCEYTDLIQALPVNASVFGMDMKDSIAELVNRLDRVHALPN